MRRQDHRGVTVLITVIIIGALIVTLGISAAFLGQSELIMTSNTDRANVARGLAASCVEEAMHRLKLNPAYTGGTIPIVSAQCTVTITGAGSGRTVTASATSGEITKTVSVIASLQQNTGLTASGWTIDAWQEVDP